MGELSPEANILASILHDHLLRRIEETRRMQYDPPPPPHPGRPREPAYVTTHQAWLTRLETAIRELECDKRPKLATRARVATLLSLDVKTLRKYLRVLAIDFDEVRRRIRHEPG